MSMEDKGDILKEIPAVVQFLYQVGSVVALPIIIWLYNKIVSHNKQAFSEAVLHAANVRTALALSEKLTAEKLAGIANAVLRTTQIAEETHQIVNGAKAILLEEIVNLKLKIAEITKSPEDYKLADIARDRFNAHLNVLMICKKDNCPSRVPISSFSQSETNPD